jgi:hypothetical protein
VFFIFFLPELYEQWVLGHVLNELKCNATIYVILSVFKHTTNRKEGFPNNSLTPFFIFILFIMIIFIFFAKIITINISKIINNNNTRSLYEKRKCTHTHTHTHTHTVHKLK